MEKIDLKDAISDFFEWKTQIQEYYHSDSFADIEELSDCLNQKSIELCKLLEEYDDNNLAHDADYEKLSQIFEAVDDYGNQLTIENETEEELKDLTLLVKDFFDELDSF